MPIGIDIEYMRERPFEKISRRFFAPSEVTAEKELFYETWTRKEASVKRDKLTIAKNLAKVAEGTIISLRNIPPDLKGAIAL